MGELTLSQFADSVSEMMPVIMREFFKKEKNGFLKLKVTMPQLVILVLLDRRGESSMSDMAVAMDVTTAAMTGMVNRLVRYGFITREHAKDDRRVVRIALTPKGSKMVKDMLEARKEIVKSIFGKLTQRDREQYLGILQRIHDALVAK